MKERDGMRERGAHIEPLGTLMYAIAPFSTRNDRRVPTPDSGGQTLAVMGEPYDITTNSAGKSLCGLGESASIS